MANTDELGKAALPFLRVAEPKYSCLKITVMKPRYREFKRAIRTFVACCNKGVFRSARAH